MKIAGLLSLGLHIKSGLAFNRILENKPKVGLDFEGWASTANGFSLSTWPRISKFSTALVDLPQVQLIIFTKQGWWKMDPHELHLAASASCNESKIPPFTWQDIFFVDIRLQSRPVKFGSIIDQCLILAGHNPLASQDNLTWTWLVSISNKTCLYNQQGTTLQGLTELGFKPDLWLD